MVLTNFRKETSERSDEVNWAKNQLVENTEYHFESIEGCNQNKNNIVTHLMERARVDYTEGKESTIEDIILQITSLEGENSLRRKINFAKCFNLRLSYILYCDEIEKIFYLNFNSLIEVEITREFNSYKDFADWIAQIKGWKSTKKYREIQDLPYFDKALRKEGTPWPTNIDCFICDISNNPIAILEFQNAKKTNVAKHCNNDFFLCKMSYINKWGYPAYHDDIRRWTSQEILRVQSGLRYFIMTWSQYEDDFMLKEVELITIPYFPEKNGTLDWDYVNEYKKDMNIYSNSDKQNSIKQKIENNYKTYNLEYDMLNMSISINNPPLSEKHQTFPSIYYKSKELGHANRMELTDKFVQLIEG